MCITSLRPTSLKFLFIITGVFTILHWFVIVPVCYTVLKDSPKNEGWIEHWDIVFFSSAFLIWAFVMFVIIGLWYLLRSRVGSKSSDAILRTKDEGYDTLQAVSDKARCTLGIDENGEPLQMEKSKLWKKRGSEKSISRKKELEDLDFIRKEITPLPEYSNAARNSIFDVQEDEARHERERSRSPFRDFLHIVPVSPDTPEQTLESDIFAEIEAKNRRDSQEELADEEAKKQAQGSEVEHLQKKEAVKQRLTSDTVSNAEGTNEKLENQNYGKPSEEKTEYLKTFEDNTSAELEVKKTDEDGLETTREDKGSKQEHSSKEPSKPDIDHFERVSEKFEEKVPSATEKEASSKKPSKPDIDHFERASREKFEEKVPNVTEKEASGTGYNAVTKPGRLLKRGESQMYLGEVESSEPVLSEILLEVSDGVIVSGSAVETGRSQVLTTHF